MTSLYQQLQGNTMSSPPVNNNNNNNNNALINLMKQFENGQLTEQQAMDKIIQMNPQMKNVFDMMKLGGQKSYKDMFYQMAKMKGVDPNVILGQLNGKV